MRRRQFLRFLLATLAFSGLTTDSVSKVLHGVAHGDERRAQEQVHASIPTVEGHDVDAEHSALHAVSVAQPLASATAMPAHVGVLVPSSEVVIVADAPRDVRNRARPPNPDTLPALPRGPPIG